MSRADRMFLLLTFFPEYEEKSAPPHCGFLIGIYLFYENWSTETFRNKESKKWAVCNTYKGAVEGNSGYWRLLIETFMGETLRPAHAMNFWNSFITG